MKQLHVLGVMLAVLVASLSVAGEDVSDDPAFMAGITPM